MSRLNYLFFSAEMEPLMSQEHFYTDFQLTLKRYLEYNKTFNNTVKPV